MATILTNSANYTNIANAIRRKNGSSNTYRPSEMANAIEAIQTGGGLPVGYTQVEYIESHGTEFINTGITLSQFAVARFAVMVTDPASFSGKGVAGVNTTSVPWASFAHYYAPNSENWYIPSNYFGRGHLMCTKLLQNTKQEFLTVFPVRTYGYFTIDSSMVIGNSTGPTSYNNTIPITIFALNDETESPAVCASFRLYYFRLIGNNYETLRDFVSCVNQSGEVGLYDLIGKTFYSNSGSGAFTAGPTVS